MKEEWRRMAGHHSASCMSELQLGKKAMWTKVEGTGVGTSVTDSEAGEVTAEKAEIGMRA